MQQAQGSRQRSVPGAAPPGAAPQQSQDNQGTRRKKSNKQQEKDGQPQTNGNASTPASASASAQSNSFAADVNTNALSAEDKKRRALLKKLGAIEQLKQRLDNGESLEKTQEKKIDSEKELRKELAALG